MKKTYALAFSSVIAALSLTLMFLTTFIPIGTYAIPCAAGAFLAAVVIESGYVTATVCYVVVSILSVLLVGDKEAGLLADTQNFEVLHGSVHHGAGVNADHCVQKLIAALYAALHQCSGELTGVV